MKLRAITLTNVRRFAGQTATLDGIGDGITVLAEPNEFGKSTFFDGLQALIFEKHRGKAKTVMALQPHSGGAPEVSAEIELPSGRFRLFKRWLSKPTARVEALPEGRIIAQDDEAEAWIERLVRGGLEGPTGLLWVRQGLLGLEPEGSGPSEKQARDRLQEARRDLLSSVAGEIDTLTGGRRMDAVLARVEADLGRLATANGRPRARGDWAMVVEEQEALEAREAVLARSAAALQAALKERREAQARRAVIEAPEAVRAREAGLAEARARHAEAEAHAARTARAADALRLAGLTREAASRDCTALAEAARLLAGAEAAEAAAAATLAREQGAARAARAAEQASGAALAAAVAVLTTARGDLATAQKAALAAGAAARLAELGARATAAEAQARRLAEAEAALKLAPPRAAELAAAEAAATALALAGARAEARAVSLRFDYAGAARALQDGAPVEGRLQVTAPTALDLPGLGRLEVDPGAGAGDGRDALAEAEAQLAAALARCGAPTLDAARAQGRAAEAQAQVRREAQAMLTALVPEGLTALRAQLAELSARAALLPPEAAAPGAADLQALEAAQAAAEADEATARHEADAARAAAMRAGEALARAEAAALAAARATAAAALDPDHAGRTAAAQAALASALREAESAAAAHAALVAAQPDLETAAAGLQRAESVVSAARREGEALATRLVELSAVIRTQAEEGIEEELGEIRGRLAVLGERAQRYATEVLALQRLREALTAARLKARDAYFGPVTKELRPLLAILHEDAELLLDDRSLLPAQLRRGGAAAAPEALDILSGGTREQIAILTRLAFARLFARNGQPVPVILDDALVHSDDQRIEAMFTALHRVARDQQILVLSCRQRAFAALGGTPARVRIEAG